jgi:hypothetical protein
MGRHARDHQLTLEEQTMTTLTRRATPVLVASGALLFGAFAAAPQAEASTYYACVNKKSGVIRLVGRTTKCRKSEKKISFNNQGLPGLNGLNGKNGLNGINGTNGTNGTNGVNGATGFTTTLPQGATEYGTWAGFMAASPYYMPISFNIPLASKPEVTIIGLKGAPTKDCPGSPPKPQATSGHLCIYTAQLVGASLFVFDPIIEGGGTGADVFGLVLFMSGSAGNYGYGTWAVTG